LSEVSLREAQGNAVERSLHPVLTPNVAGFLTQERNQQIKTDREHPVRLCLIRK